MLDEPKTLYAHLRELRNRLAMVSLCFAACFAGCYHFSSDIQYLLMKPLQPLFDQGRSMVYTSLPEAFLSEINTSLFASFLLTFPFLLMQIWLFSRPGLFKIERQILRVVMICIPGLFYLGVMFAHTVVLPRAFEFFINFEHGAVPLYFLPKISDYINFVQRLMFVFGIGFELPILLFTLVSFGMLSLQSMKSKWRIVVFLLCALSAVITPPDALSMVALAVPMIVLYGVTIIVIQWSQYKIKNNTDSYHA